LIEEAESLLWQPGDYLRFIEMMLNAPFCRALPDAQHPIFAIQLTIRDEADGSATRTGHCRDVWVFRIAEPPSVFKDEDRARVHVLRDKIFELL
jgi:hypothetical protein